MHEGERCGRIVFDTNARSVKIMRCCGVRSRRESERGGGGGGGGMKPSVGH